jgi:hypothetical protein
MFWRPCRSTSFVPLFSFFLFSPTSSLLLFLAGDLTQWHLPVGMQDLDLAETNVTGKAMSE